MFMAQERYIQVMLPLKLEWEPYYKLPEGMEAALGDRMAHHVDQTTTDPRV